MRSPLDVACPVEHWITQLWMWWSSLATNSASRSCLNPYLLMAAAGWLVWRHRIHEDLWLALALFMAQLILNGLWSFVIFGGRRPGAALVEITVLLVAVAMTAMRFAELSRLAFWLMTPYFAWALYASYLNFGILRLNKGTA